MLEDRKFDSKKIDQLDSPERAARFDVDGIMSQLPIKPHHVVAEIGCGTGFFTIPLSRRLPQGRVIALDILEEMLDRVRNKVEQAGAANVAAMLCGETDLPLEPDSVDRVFLAFLLHEMEDRADFLERVRGHLRPGGWVGILEWVKKETGMGPPLSVRLDPDEGRELAVRAGLRVVGGKAISENFYMIILEKRSADQAHNTLS
jgi:ubiquinone/menaquinone biosynthesis C-methylase UbiE